MRACGSEIGRVAFAHVVNVEPVLSGSEVRNFQIQLNSAASLGKHGSADRRAFGVKQVSLGFQSSLHCDRTCKETEDSTK